MLHVAHVNMRTILHLICSCEGNLYLEDPDKARNCSTNTMVYIEVFLLINSATQSVYQKEKKKSVSTWLGYSKSCTISKSHFFSSKLAAIYIVWCSAVYCSLVLFSAVKCSAVHCSALQYTGLQCTALHCSPVQWHWCQWWRKIFISIIFLLTFLNLIF